MALGRAEAWRQLVAAYHSSRSSGTGMASGSGYSGTGLEYPRAATRGNGYQSRSGLGLIRFCGMSVPVEESQTKTLGTRPTTKTVVGTTEVLLRLMTWQEDTIE